LGEQNKPFTGSTPEAFVKSKLRIT